MHLPASLLISFIYQLNLNIEPMVIWGSKFWIIDLLVLGIQMMGTCLDFFFIFSSVFSAMAQKPDHFLNAELFSLIYEN